MMTINKMYEMQKHIKFDAYTNDIKPRPLNKEYSLGTYVAAVRREGDLAYQWSDKPHRLVYDLVAYAKYLEERNTKDHSKEKIFGDSILSVLNLRQEQELQLYKELKEKYEVQDY